MSTRQANILDPIHDTLDPRVWDKPEDPLPHLRDVHRDWLISKITQTLKNEGYTGWEDWLSLVFTGSLTTYQYSDESDVDISLFVDVDHFPDWDRAKMIGVMVQHMDGTKLPGTPHPLQCFVVPPNITRGQLYAPGLRSGYDLFEDTWVNPPEKNRVHDVAKEMNGSYVYALEVADKMERLLQFEPDKAVMFWHQIHKRRRKDQQLGKGDFAESNIAYKMLANRGLFPSIADASGEYIASENSASKPKGAIRLAKARVLFQKFKPTQVHPGNDMPLIYEPKLDTIFLGPPGTYHWDLLRKTPELKDQYPADEAWTKAPFLVNTEHMQGRMTWPGKEISFYGSIPSELQQRIAEGLGGTITQADDWEL